MGERTDQQEEEAARSGEEGTGKETETNEEEGNCGKGEKGRNGNTSVAEREQKIRANDKRKQNINNEMMKRVKETKDTIRIILTCKLIILNINNKNNNTAEN